MASFDIAYNITSRHEGGYVNDPKDKGRETYAGVSRKAHPEWSGWRFLDAQSNKKTGQKYPTLESQRKDLLREKYWTKNRLGEVVNQDVANVIFDFAINSGGAIKVIQGVLGIVRDGIVGPITLKAINEKNPDELYNAINKARREYIIKNVEDGNIAEKFLAGLLRRVDSFGVKK